MREIKFRAWDKHNKTMWPIKTLRFNQETGVLEALGFSYRGAVFPQNDEKNILMQFTGLLDKNGKEIFCLDYLNENLLVLWDCDNPRYISIDISSGDIMPLIKGGGYENTGNYFENHKTISDDAKRFVDKCLS